MADRSRTQLRAIGLSVVLLTAAAGCTPLDDFMANIAVERSMRIQPSVGAYEDPRLPAEGTVPFAAGNFPEAPGRVNTGQPEVAVVPPPLTPIQILSQAPEATEIPNPVPSSPASLARGETLFLRSCSPCHGATGAGDGTVVEAGMPAMSLLTDQTRGYTDGYIYTMIRYGRGAMPGYGHQITHYDRWNLVNYVRQLQGPAPTPAPETPQGQD